MIQVRRERARVQGERGGDGESVEERCWRGDLHVTGWVGFHHIFST